MTKYSHPSPFSSFSSFYTPFLPLLFSAYLAVYAIIGISAYLFVEVGIVPLFSLTLVRAVRSARSADVSRSREGTYIRIPT